MDVVVFDPITGKRFWIDQDTGQFLYVDMMAPWRALANEDDRDQERHRAGD